MVVRRGKPDCTIRCDPVDLAVKAAVAAGVTSAAIAPDIDVQHEAILIAIDPDFANGLDLT